MSLDQTEAHLAAEARYAADRVALYRQRLYAGSGELRRLAELERVASGAAERLARHRAAAGDPAQDAGLRTEPVPPTGREDAGPGRGKTPTRPGR